LNKLKILPFILGNAVIGAGLVLVTLLNTFALRGILRTAVSVLAVAAAGLSFLLLLSWVSEKKRPMYIGEENPAAPLAALNNCKSAIEGYLRENQSTPFFREKLKGVAERLNTFGSRCETIRNIIIERFGSAGLSYGKFAAPVTALQEHLITLASNLVSRMRVFNEEEYGRRIEEFTKTNRIKEATDYKEIEQEYKDYAEKTIAAYDSAILKLDKLALEISKLRESDVDKAMHIMHDLDAAIKDTQLYK